MNWLLFWLRTTREERAMARMMGRDIAGLPLCRMPAPPMPPCKPPKQEVLYYGEGPPLPCDFDTYWRSYWSHAVSDPSKQSAALQEVAAKAFEAGRRYERALEAPINAHPCG